MRPSTLCLLLVALLSKPALANHPLSVYHNDEALERLKEENHYLAYKEILLALEADPLNPALQYNLGVAFIANEEFEKARKQFVQVDQLTEDEELKFQARFAAGISAAQNKDIDRALEHYQAALELKPDSEEVKKNIELLWQGGGQSGEGGDQQQQQQEGQEGDNQSEGDQGDQEKDQKDQQGQDQQNQKPSNQKPQPRPFKSKELTPDQVRKILEELKAQEQKIRAEEYGEGGKDAPNEKDW